MIERYRMFPVGVGCLLLASNVATQEPGQPETRDVSPQQAIQASAAPEVLGLEVVMGAVVVRSAADPSAEPDRVGRVADVVLGTDGRFRSVIVECAVKAAGGEDPDEAAEPVEPKMIALSSSELEWEAKSRGFKIGLSDAVLESRPEFDASALIEDRPQPPTDGGENAGRPASGQTLLLLGSELGRLGLNADDAAISRSTRPFVSPDARSIAFVGAAIQAAPGREPMTCVVPWSLVRPGVDDDGLRLDVQAGADKLAAAPRPEPGARDFGLGSTEYRTSLYEYFATPRPAWDVLKKGGDERLPVPASGGRDRERR